MTLMRRAPVLIASILLTACGSAEGPGDHADAAVLPDPFVLPTAGQGWKVSAPGAEAPGDASDHASNEAAGTDLRLDCSPPALHFGVVPDRLATIEGTFRCYNSSSSDDPRPIVVRSVHSDVEAVHVDIRNTDGTEGARPEGYLPGESFLISLRLSTEVEPRDGLIVIETEEELAADPSIPLHFSEPKPVQAHPQD